MANKNADNDDAQCIFLTLSVYPKHMTNMVTGVIVMHTPRMHVIISTDPCNTLRPCTKKCGYRNSRSKGK